MSTKVQSVRGPFCFGGEEAFMENRVSVRVCGYMYFR